ncbi:MAG: DedA family protein [Thaumarchaeota archaeon]|nr:DedA family protein [Nitrososphaerota archaeon]
MSISSQIFNFALSLIVNSGYSGVFVLMVLESATLPVPSEVVLPIAGWLVSKNILNFWVVVIVASIGSLIGTLIDYSIGYYLGRAAILRYGRIVRLNENHLKTTEKWFAKHGELIVLLARFVPLIRTLIAFPAGIAEMKLWKFVSFSIIGIVIWDAILIYLGVLFGQNYNSIVSTLSNAFTLVEILSVVVAIIVLYLWLRRKAPQKEKAQP